MLILEGFHCLKIRLEMRSDVVMYLTFHDHCYWIDCGNMVEACCYYPIHRNLDHFVLIHTLDTCLQLNLLMNLYRWQFDSVDKSAARIQSKYLPAHYDTYDGGGDANDFGSSDNTNKLNLLMPYQSFNNNVHKSNFVPKM